MDRKLLNKHGAVVSKLARCVMALDPGDRLPTIVELTETFSVSRGIVQNAIAFLEDAGCFSLTRCGKLGTVLERIDYEKLYTFTGWNPIVGAMPVPFNESFRTLAAALHAECQRMPVESSVIYVSGARVRRSMLKKDFLDYAVTSLAAARQIAAEDEALEILFELPDCRYEEPYALLFLNPDETEIRDGMRVGTDPDTIDQTELTKAICQGKAVEFVPMPFEGTIETLHDKRIDCTVIRREKWLEENLQLALRPIPPTSYPAGDTTVPAILINRENYGIRAFLEKYLSPAGICQAQLHAKELQSRYSF
ncbi:MAG: YhfZ family protein [Oscillospiraceae bacterium]|jgi:hypothetical protein